MQRGDGSQPGQATAPGDADVVRRAQESEGEAHSYGSEGFSCAPILRIYLRHILTYVLPTVSLTYPC